MVIQVIHDINCKRSLYISLRILVRLARGLARAAAQALRVLGAASGQDVKDALNRSPPAATATCFL